MRMKPSQQESRSQARRQKRYASIRSAAEAANTTGLYIPERVFWKPVCSKLFWLVVVNSGSERKDKEKS